MSYSLSTNFRLKLIEPSAREVEGQQFFLNDAVRVSLGSSHVLFSSPPFRPPGSSLSNRVQKNKVIKKYLSMRKFLETLYFVACLIYALTLPYLCINLSWL